MRTIELRPGLNFVWSPDPADVQTQGETNPAAQDDVGHGAGKSLFCRLLRYCLGEDRFAPEAQRPSIARTFLTGWVSAEVMLHGRLWGVLRPLSVGRGHFAVEGVLPEELFDLLAEPTGMTPLLQAIENQVLTPDVAKRIAGLRTHDAWRVALAWLTRDQECRFDHVLDWRAAESDSESPVRNMSRGRLLDAMRVLIGAIATDEIALQDSVSANTEIHKAHLQQSARREWACSRNRLDIIQALGLASDEVPEGKLGIESLRQAAHRHLAKVSQVSPGANVFNLDDLRQRSREAQQHVSELSGKLAVLQSTLPLHEELQRQYRAELPSISVRLREAEVPVCQICEVPIDRIRAEGCKLSHKLPDLGGLKRRHEAVTQKISQQQTLINDQKAAVASLNQQLPAARTAMNTLRQELSRAEKLSTQRSSAWFNARRLLDDIQRLGADWDTWEQVQKQTAEMAAKIDSDRGQLAAFRDRQATVFNHLSTYFDAIIRLTVGPTASGRVTLDGNGLKLGVQFGGERSSPAIESLKIIAFDLAVMCMSIGGKTQLPAFLLHDSPREADLGLSVYHRLFKMVATLEGQNSSPFQYIVTTTTQPPAVFQKAPWLRLELHGAPASERLLRCDLP
ncbi:chromosome segregation protein SMC [Pigmentiphaga aceris]|uniref:Chromosome segregation protein SMC n=1 Tax=Pigmentiphaga aceris TaxID=1940612 RepID=A0A5C0AU41_9BURK|nr:chromosome segregation protein SMC [Pigmentiphaga aceris]QEI05808.1 chromosome segregation protein SMC [Pigmentiphaga aceris]